jgi:hypothetical protein
MTRLDEILAELRSAEEAAQMQDRIGNEGDADAIRRDAIRRALAKGEEVSETETPQPEPQPAPDEEEGGSDDVPTDEE